MKKAKLIIGIILCLALAGCAAAMGCGVIFIDVHGFAPRYNDVTLKNVFEKIGLEFFAEEDVRFTESWGTASSDMGDISCIMPAIHPYAGGAIGIGHGKMSEDEAKRYAHFLKKNGVMIVNDTRIDPMTVVIGAKTYPEGILEKLALVNKYDDLGRKKGD